MALQKKRADRKQKKARELFFSRPKKKITIKPLSKITPKKYWHKMFWPLFLSKTVI
jgi:hypothetical protein